MILKITIIVLFCFFNTVRASSSRKLGREQKKKERTGEGEGNEGTFLFSPPPPPSNLFFCSCSTFRAITRLETLATQATASFHNVEFELSTSPYYGIIDTRAEKEGSHQPFQNPQAWFFIGSILNQTIYRLTRRREICVFLKQIFDYQNE